MESSSNKINSVHDSPVVEQRESDGGHTWSEKAFSQLLKEDILEDLHAAAHDSKRESTKGKPRQLIIKRADRLSLQTKNQMNSEKSIFRGSTNTNFKNSPNEKSRTMCSEQSQLKTSISHEYSTKGNPVLHRFISQDASTLDTDKDIGKVGEYRGSGFKDNHLRASSRDMGSFRIRSVSRHNQRDRSTSYSSKDPLRQREASIRIPIDMLHDDDQESPARPRSNAIYIKDSLLKSSRKTSIEDLVNNIGIKNEKSIHKLNEEQAVKATLEKAIDPNDVYVKNESSPSLRDFSNYIFSSDTIDEGLKENFFNELKTDFIFSKSLMIPKVPHCTYRLKRYDASKKLLFLDLDETLITSEMVNEGQQLKVIIRPYVREFLKECSRSWNVVIFTASTRKYAENILGRIDKDSTMVADILCREQCLQFGSQHVKDLRVIEQTAENLGNVLIIDNKIACFSYQLTNGIPILPFKGNTKDTELKHLSKILDFLAKEESNIVEWIKSRYDHEQFLAA